MDWSEGVPSTSASVPGVNFGDRVTYPAANLQSDLKEETVEKFVEKFVDKYRIIRGLDGVYHASSTDRIHHNPEVPTALGKVATGISEVAFQLMPLQGPLVAHS